MQDSNYSEQPQCDPTPLVCHLLSLHHHSHGITLNEIKYILAKTIVRPWYACMSFKHIYKLPRIVKLKTFRYMRTFTENSKPPKYGIVHIRKCHLREVIGRQPIFLFLQRPNSRLEPINYSKFPCVI